MTSEQEKDLLEAVRFLLRDKQQASRIEASSIRHSDSERATELRGDAVYCGDLLGRL